jgi:hypothetical protein
MPDLAVKCPSCGYDFPPQEIKTDNGGWEFSDLSDIILLIGQIAALVGAAYFIYYSVQSLIGGEILSCGFGLTSAIVQLALYITFARIQKTRK